MLEKINGKKKLLFQCFIVSLFFVLIYSRFVSLNWGFPYPMHPDERNMASATQSLNCGISNFKFQISNFKECFNPHFFAYGQLPLYLGYIIVFFLKFFDGDIGSPIGFQEAAISLRIISAVASIINSIIIIKIINIIIKKKSYLLLLISYLLVIFSPYAIQFAHFGTTESLLMLFYSLIIYLSMLILERHKSDAVAWVALISGLAIASKASSIIFIIVPLITILSSQRSWDRYKNLVKFGVLTIIFVVLFSPHNFINFRDFVSSMNYESEVALGKSLVFYTRQFFDTQPFMFQFEKVFPYVLGWPVFLMGLMGLIGTNWKDKKTNLLRIAFLIYFVPSAMIYAKWSRFMAPVLPLMSIFSILFILNIKDQISLLRQDYGGQVKIHIKYQNFYILICNFAFCFLIFAIVIPGIAYLSVYRNPDVRFQASEWIYKNIPNNSYILSETANVVDIPTSNGTMKQSNNYSVISFNFYDLDQSPELQLDLKNHLEKADYIFVPSRRIFANHTCEKNFQFSIFNFQSDLENKCQNLKQKYPILNKYYEDLFSGKLGFIKVAEFNSYPKIKLFGQTLMEFPDEQAEETWTVFDHPVIRIYKRISGNSKS